MIEPNEMIRRLNQIENELVGPVFTKLEGKTDIEIGLIVGEMDKAIAVCRRMVARLVNDIEDEEEKDRLAEEEHRRLLAEYEAERKKRESLNAIADGPGGEADA